MTIVELTEPTLEAVAEVVATLKDQGFIDVGPTERGVDFIAVYDAMVLLGIAEKDVRTGWLKLINEDAADSLNDVLTPLVERQEVMENTGEYHCAYKECPNKASLVEPMLPYIIVVVNNTEEPEQTTFRFDTKQCFEKWDETSGIQYGQ